MLFLSWTIYDFSSSVTRWCSLVSIICSIVACTDYLLYDMWLNISKVPVVSRLDFDLWGYTKWNLQYLNYLKDLLQKQVFPCKILIFWPNWSLLMCWVTYDTVVWCLKCHASYDCQIDVFQDIILWPYQAEYNSTSGTNMNTLYTEGIKFGDNRAHFIIVMQKGDK